MVLTTKNNLTQEDESCSSKKSQAPIPTAAVVTKPETKCSLISPAPIPTEIGLENFSDAFLNRTFRVGITPQMLQPMIQRWLQIHEGSDRKNRRCTWQIVSLLNNDVSKINTMADTILTHNQCICPHEPQGLCIGHKVMITKVNKIALWCTKICFWTNASNKKIFHNNMFHLAVNGIVGHIEAIHDCELQFDRRDNSICIHISSGPTSLRNTNMSISQTIFESDFHGDEEQNTACLRSD